MARAATTTDTWNAVAEPARRRILELLRNGERPVNDLVLALGVAQPQVSKHLRVLREVGAVQVREEGRQRFYRADAAALRPIHEWVAAFADAWEDRFQALDAVLADMGDQNEEER